MTFLVAPRIVLLLSFVSLVNSLSNGAIGCEGGEAAVSGLHKEQATVLTGPLSQDDIEFQIDGERLQPGVPFNIELGVDYDWKLITAGTFFRGFLVRLGRGDGNVDTRTSLATNSPTAQVAETACVEAYLVGGITQTSNVLKNLEEGSLRVHLPSQNMPLDVTVVIQNRNGYSIYYYSQFTINAIPPGSNPTASNNSPGVPTIPTYTPYYPPPTAQPVTSPVTPVPTAPPMVSPENLSPVVPVPAPTTADPVPAVNLFLRFPTCSTDAPCGNCQGDCDVDSDCAAGLECFHRPQEDTSPVPGCIGNGVYVLSKRLLSIYQCTIILTHSQKSTGKMIQCISNLYMRRLI